MRDARQALVEHNVVAIGVSPDEPETQLKFDTKHALQFALLSDPDHETAEAYGVWVEKSMYGKKHFGILRSSFLLDERGRVLNAWYKVSPDDTVPLALAALAGTP